MAILSSDKTYVTVEKGDSLWAIAAAYCGSGLSYTQLASINGISSPYYIYVGQKIKLTGTATSTSSSNSSSSVATITAFGLQANTDNTLFATWSWGNGNTASYAVEWSYQTTDNRWFIGSSSSNSVDDNNPDAAKQSTYSIPANAKAVRFRVKPISKTKTSNNTTTSYWTASWTSYKTYSTGYNGFGTPAVPTVKIDKFQLTASLDNLDVNAPMIHFQVYKDDTTLFAYSAVAITATNSVSYTCTVDAGGEYKVRARAYASSATYGEWSDFSSAVSTIPAASSGITTIKANSETSVYLEWEAAGTADTYEIEYSTKKEYFDNSSQTSKVSSIEYPHYEVTGLESGQEYFFRVRAVNTQGNSAWTDIQSVIIGEDPTAPTTWSSTTTCIVGEPLILYWVHNAKDGSSQTYAELEITIDGATETYTIKNTEDEDEKDKTSSYSINTTDYSEGTTIQWRVRTAGITKSYGDWSVQRSIDIYAPPTLALKVTDVGGNLLETLETFPFHIYALPGPNTQAPIGYHVSIVSNEIYETTDNIGNVKMVNAGEEIYSKHFGINQELDIEMSANNVDLENGITYTITVTVSMNSGLTTVSSTEFVVSWTDEYCAPNAEIGIDEDTIAAYIRPYCESSEVVFYQVVYNSTTDSYTNTKSTVTMAEGIPVEVDGENVYTVDGEQVFSGTTIDGDKVYYCTILEKYLLEDVTLSVYRREFDGSFTELATGIDNNFTFVTDPHPALDYARYRIVAISNSTGAVSYSDLPGYPTGETAVIIQWDEQWSNFDVTDEDELAQPPWSGSMLKLPYNIDVSDSSSPDTQLIKYIGREHPVSYYGTQIGHTANWNVDIVYDDKETLYGLRRLQRWMGDVYVREPSGSGYWASITVSFNQKHCELAIPVTMSVTRVEGGI